MALLGGISNDISNGIVGCRSNDISNVTLLGCSSNDITIAVKKALAWSSLRCYARP